MPPSAIMDHTQGQVTASSTTPLPYLSTSSRRHRASSSTATSKSDFLDFLHKLLDLCFAPITFPLKVVRNVVTSPLTISLILQLVLLGFLILSSAVFSVLAVGAFWWSWSTGGVIEVEGWLVYGKLHRTPHTSVTLPVDRFQEDLPYDVQVELELVRPFQGAEDTGNFMVTLELWSLRSPDLILSKAAQPSLPPSPLPSPLLNLPLPQISSFLPPCLLPWPFRFLCPSRLFGLSPSLSSNSRSSATGRRRDGFRGAIKKNQIVLLKKELLDGVVVRPVLGGDAVVGSAFVSIGREDAFSEAGTGINHKNEIRTTGLVVIRFLPRPTGLRWLLASNPLPPLILLPPLSLALTLTSSIMAFGIITCLRRRPRSRKSSSRPTTKRINSSRSNDPTTSSPVVQVHHHHHGDSYNESPRAEKAIDTASSTLRERNRGRPSLGQEKEQERERLSRYDKTSTHSIHNGSTSMGSIDANVNSRANTNSGTGSRSESSVGGSSKDGRGPSVVSSSEYSDVGTITGAEETATEEGDGDGTSQATESDGWEDAE